MDDHPGGMFQSGLLILQSNVQKWIFRTSRGVSDEHMDVSEESIYTNGLKFEEKHAEIYFEEARRGISEIQTKTSERFEQARTNVSYERATL